MTPRNVAQKSLIFVASAGFTSLFFINFCATVFHCGCRAMWLGAAAACNIHMEGAHHCPWCAQNPAYAFAAMVVPQGLISYWSVQWAWWKRLGAALAAFPVFGGIAAAVYGVITGYWKILMPSAIVVGGGLAGLAATAALADVGFTVDLFEARGFLGGRATSYPVSPADEDSEVIDNCQHVLLRCCVNLLDFYRRLGVGERVRFSGDYYFVEPGGRVSTLKRGLLPAPLHFAESFLRLRFLSLADKLAIARGMLAIRAEHGARQDLDRISMLEWLREKRQTPVAIDRFWRQVLVSAINEDLDRMAAAHGFQVFWLGFLARPDAYEMGVPAVPLAELYSENVWRRFEGVSVHLRSAVACVDASAGVTLQDGSGRRADFYVVCVPPERVGGVAPGLAIDTGWVEHSPITGIHLWFDRPVTELPHATLLDRTMQWMFNKNEGRYVQLVVSASRSLSSLPKADVIALALRELGEFFPAAREAKLERSHVVKEMRATFSALPGLEGRRPGCATNAANVFLAGDWTRSGWPATMEGAVRSGYIAAEAVTGKKFLLPDAG